MRHAVASWRKPPRSPINSLLHPLFLAATCPSFLSSWNHTVANVYKFSFYREINEWRPRMKGGADKSALCRATSSWVPPLSRWESIGDSSGSSELSCDEQRSYRLFFRDYRVHVYPADVHREDRCPDRLNCQVTGVMNWFFAERYIATRNINHWSYISCNVKCLHFIVLIIRFDSWSSFYFSVILSRFWSIIRFLHCSRCIDNC